MRTAPITLEDLQGVFPVPPLARRHDAQRTLDFNASTRIVDHLAAAGMTRLLFGGNAFLYHLSLRNTRSFWRGWRVCRTISGASPAPDLHTAG